MSRKICNLKRDTIDGTEKKFKLDHPTVFKDKLPDVFDLRDTHITPPILDQGQLGACGPNAISNALRYCVEKELGRSAKWQPSRLYIYYFTRQLEGSPIDQDTGISIKGGMKAVSKNGACSENNWPYIISMYRNKPNNGAIKAGKSHIAGFKYLSVRQNLEHIKRALVSNYPIVVGLQVYESFDSLEASKNGIVPMPKRNEQLLGGHAVIIWGYNDNQRRFICSNSWSTQWGNNGYFTIPYEYIINPNLASDMWTAKYFR
jgi:C1A family cysteine protease